jgi:rhodanese-related sulfurtransferase
MLEFYADPTSEDHRPEFDPNRRTILYCAGGARSALAVETLQQLGYTNVAHLEGGLSAWTSAGREVMSPAETPQTPAASPSSFSTITQSRH